MSDISETQLWSLRNDCVHPVHFNIRYIQRVPGCLSKIVPPSYGLPSPSDPEPDKIHHLRGPNEADPCHP